ncbi:hypothetical protein Y032_0558g3414 [Ancylostoma ceylanicum]|uniref:Uncharacterized protein n=1 Tax=Ancylostoma ceylanicum TaxID=53326 RepID=A0A016WPI8_9BILA|nr:hypothetical protein Y032_0558g3414 [Ancylostoma ceylanicum]
MDRMKRLLLIEGCPSERCTHIPGNDKGVSEAYYFLTYISEIGGISGGCALIPNEDSGDDNSVKAGFFISPQHVRATTLLNANLERFLKRRRFH